MKVNRLVLEALVLGVILMALLLRGLSVTAGPMPPANQGSVDSTTVARLTRSAARDQPSSIQAATVVTGTVAAVLAAELLLNPIYFNLDLPIVTK